MGLDSYTYIGAFLILEDIWEDQKELVITKRCPDHGLISGSFCSTCGKKSLVEEKPSKKIKRLTGLNEIWEDWMYTCRDLIKKEDSTLILIPNHHNTGRLEGLRDSDFGYMELSEETRKECIQKLLTYYKDYIRWLEEVRKFKIAVSFGVYKYYA